jgi:peroxiredoxin
MWLSPVWMLSFAALWVLMALVAVAQALLIRHTLRVEQELLAVDDGPELGAEVPSLRLAGLDGELRDLVPAADRRLALFFISPGCPACGQVCRTLQALPDLVAVDVVVVCGAPPESSRRYVERHGISWPVVTDPEGTAMRVLGVAAVPFAVVLDPRGRVERKGTPASYTDLLDLLGNPPEAVAELAVGRAG